MAISARVADLQGELNILAFVDADLLISRGTAASVRFWRAPPGGTAGSMGGSLFPHISDVIGVAVVDGAKRLLTSAVGSTAVWDLDEARRTELLCQRADRDLTIEEWAPHMGQRRFRATCIEAAGDG